MPPTPDKKRAEFTIPNELGLHFRVAALIVRALDGYSSEVTISNGEAVADARSVLDLMTLAAARGSRIVVEADGADADAAIAALSDLISSNFAE